jgi:hypothetical protein
VQGVEGNKSAVKKTLDRKIRSMWGVFSGKDKPGENKKERCMKRRSFNENE